MGRPKGSKNVKAETVEEAPVVVAEPTINENMIYIENLPLLKAAVEADLLEKKLNPSVVHEGEAGIVWVTGEPMMIIDNQYVPVDEAKLVLQERSVVREWIKLERLKQGIKE